MSQRRILVVDDELINLEIIREYLEEAHYDLDLVTSADQAWLRLDGGDTAYDLVILDRMMPGMSGIELLKKMKAETRFRAIPVIMQTAASAPEQIREGIEAGAYYYLPKPYEPEVLTAIVRAALADIQEREEAGRHAAAHVKAMELIDLALFRFSRIDEVGPLIEVLASLCPAPELAASGLTELLVNAVEHGNLGISYADKKRLRLEDRWEAEVARRFALPEYHDRCVRVRVERHFDRLEFTVTDEGEGFDWQRYMEFDPERAGDPNGRGIAMARMLSFATLEYRGNGNTVVATIRTLH
ncbi:MAG: response regulator [Rhodocyclaceae bacterium]|jgi:CheY-like chemotaxis protein/anti-sigma regulatory factor (Ser/Thr protein kinase)|nr:response regulator [Rhodocyclaceae bacterium]